MLLSVFTLVEFVASERSYTRGTRKRSREHNKMPFFFTLRQSSSNTIEPSLLPTSSGPKFSTNWSTSPFYEYITTWDFTDRPGTFRRLACIMAFVLHIPLNIISILSWGFLFIFLGILLSLLNLACVGAALWKLDVMSGERQFYGRS